MMRRVFRQERVMTMRRWIIVGMVGAGIAASLFFLTLPHQPAVKAGEDGTFANDCCGTIKLADGKMLLNDQQVVRYTVARDGAGPYLLPHTYVGVVPYEGFDVDGTRSILKLRFDRLPAPNRIELYDGSTPYSFTRARR
jgi:hypothetical protein